MQQSLSVSYDMGLAQHFRRTFSWMLAGLIITFVTALAFYVSNLWQYIFMSSSVVFGLCIAEIFLVMYLSLRVYKMPFAKAKGLFVAYALVNGITFTSIFIMYDMISLVLIFALTSVFFGVLVIYGVTTKRNLMGWGPYLMAGLVVLLLFWVLSIFLNLQRFEMMFCIGGLILFMALTAYDVQKVKRVYDSFQGDEAMLQKCSIISALSLYLDFINMFMYLLRIFGNRK